jgi:hypothetical protein
MKKSRRKVLAYTSLGVVGSTSGCLGLLGSSDTPEEDQSSEDNSEQPNQQPSTNTDPEPEPDDDNEEEKEWTPVLSPNLSKIQEFIIWLNTDYQTARSRYTSRLEDANSKAEELVEDLDRIEGETIDNEKKSEISSKLDEFVNLIRSIAEPVDELATYYDDNIGFRKIADSLENSYPGALTRGEYDVLSAEISQIQTQLTAFSFPGEIPQRYPEDIIYGGPLSVFARGESTNKIFEVQYVSDDGSVRDTLWACASRVNFETYPFGKSMGNITPDYVNSVGGTPREKRNVDIFDNSSWLNFEREREAKLHMNIIDYGDNFPGEYTFGGETDPNANNVGELPSVQVNGEPQMSVYIQYYNNSNAAKNAFQTIEKRGQDEGSINYNNFTYRKLSFNDVGSTYYADVRRENRYVIAVDISTTPWDQREFSTPVNDQEGTEAREVFLSSTFLNPQTPEEFQNNS